MSHRTAKTRYGQDELQFIRSHMSPAWSDKTRASAIAPSRMAIRQRLYEPMPPIDYHRLRQQITMREVLHLIGFRATWRRGSQHRGSCPIPGCRSKASHSFSVHLTRQCYHCFACHSHGNHLDLWAAVRRLPLHHAALSLCCCARLPLPRLGSSLTPTLRHARCVPFRAPLRNH
jgi:hypothetical protein